MTVTRTDILTLADLDQLTAGLARSDPAAVDRARAALMDLALQSSPALLRWLFEAFSQQMEQP